MVDDAIKTKVLGHLMNAMVGLHGNSVPKIKTPHETNAVLPNPDGSQKHEPVGKIEGEGVMPGKSHHFDLQHTEISGNDPDMNDHDGDEANLGDLFGRKKPAKAEYF